MYFTYISSFSLVVGTRLYVRAWKVFSYTIQINYLNMELRIKTFYFRCGKISFM